MENVGAAIAGGDLKLHNISSMNGAGSSSINSTTLSDGSLQKFDDDDDESDSDWDGFPVSDKRKERNIVYEGEREREIAEGKWRVIHSVLCTMHCIHSCVPL